MALEVPAVVGFGFCAREERHSDVQSTFTYRYVPAEISDPDPRRVLWGFNQTGQGRDGQPDARPALDSELSPSGLSAYESMPVYGTLDVGPDEIEWTGFWDGQAAVGFKANALGPVLETALCSSPQQLWAHRHFDGNRESIYGMGDPDAEVMAMVEGESGLLTAAPFENVEVPSGLLKTVLLVPNPRLIESIREEGVTAFELVAGATATLQSGGALQCEELSLIKLQIAASLVPGLLEWARSDEFLRDEPWSVPSVFPCGDWRSPRVFLADSGNLLGVAVIPFPAAELDESDLQELELFIRNESAARQP